QELEKGGQRGGGLSDDRPTVPCREPTGALQGSAEVCGRTTSAGRANSGGVPHLAGTPSRSGSSRDVAGQGGGLHVGAMAQAHSLPGSPGDRPGYQRVRGGNTPLCVRQKKLAVFWQPPWRCGQRDVVQHHRDRQGQRAGTLLVSAKALRGTPHGPLGHRYIAPGPVSLRRSLTRPWWGSPPAYRAQTIISARSASAGATWASDHHNPGV